MKNPAIQPSPTISVVIPTLNEEGSLIAAIGSASDADEIVVVDGGSSDRTRAVAEESGARVLVSAPSRGLQMAEGAKAQYAWVVDGGQVNFDTHGDARGKSISYEKGRGVAADEGVLEAAFAGNHGWYWRNRGQANVTVILRTSGDYSDIKRMK